MSPAPVGFGLLGTGLIAPFHARAMAASSKATLIAAADVDGSRLSRFCREFGCKGYASLDAMLQDPAVQVVNILTPNHLHLAAVLCAAAAGRHVMIEKPPGMSMREMDDMEASIATAGVKAGVVLQCRARRAVRAMKTAVAEGRFGRILHADAYMKWFRPADYYRMDPWRSSRRCGAGVTVQQAFHYIDLLQHLVGPVCRVQARMTNLAHPSEDLEDTLLAFVDYECGAQGVLQASTALWPGTDLRIEINGERGTAILVGERIDTWRFREEGPQDEEIRTYGSSSAATGATGAADLGFYDHLVVIEDMVDAVITGREPMIPLASVRPTLEWALALYRSARQDARVGLPIPCDYVIE